MVTPKDAMSWWTRNFQMVALPVFVSFVVISWLSPSLDYNFFCTGEAPCFREWVGALSGYVALLVGYFTLREMINQRRLQTEIQRQNVELTVMGRLAIAYQYRVHVVAIHELCKTTAARFSVGEIENEFGSASHALESAIRALEYITEQMSDERISIFEQQIGTGLTPSLALVSAKAIEETLKGVRDGIPKAARAELSEITFYLGQVPLALLHTLQYTEIGAKTSGAFIAKWEPYISA